VGAGVTVRLTVVGDALLDRDVDGDVRRLAPDAPVPVVDHERTSVRAGGAGLAATLAARAGATVRLVTALSGDGPATELRRALADAGVEVVELGLDGGTPEKIRIRAQGRSLLRLDRGGGGRIGPATAAARAAIGWADAVLVADYGRGVAAHQELRTAVHRAGARDVPVVWDPHPDGACPVPGATVVTPNEHEAARFAPAVGGIGAPGAIARAEALRTAWDARWVCVTRGAAGVALAGAGVPSVVRAAVVSRGDACGAGDRFASALAQALGGGADVPEATWDAVRRAAAFVASGGVVAGGARPGTDARGDADADADATTVIQRTRAHGGTVVATGGCFDLLHPGHIQTLQAARALGDCLVVCLNSDASIRRLKGPGRPLVGEHDRAAVLRALRCVDAVQVFDQDTPVELLRHLRPDLWVKGGDYTAVDMPEAPVLASWGGRAIVVPFVEGRSTTRLIQEAALHAV
jgi:rfaE bifunctional protein nucleotidyltransferase chain/domain/rfaE bifunctional protein kinase chain/domain